MIQQILTTHKAQDRLDNVLRHLDNYGFNPSPFYAIEDNNPKYSFNKSMQHIMNSHEGVLLVFEDDVLIKENAHFWDAYKQLPSDWELCYLGANIVDHVERFSKNLFWLHGAWTTHAVIYNNPKKICDGYVDTTIMFDDWLRTNIHPRGKSFIISPMMAWQSPHDSDLWNHYADYTRIFDDSANKIL